MKLKLIFMNLLLITISVSASLFSFTYINKNKNNSRIIQRVIENVDNSELNQSIADIRRDISLLSEKIARYEAKENATNTQETEYNRPGIPDSGYMQTKEQIREEINLNKEKIAEYFKNFSDNVAYQNPDPAWANDAEKTIYEAVDDDPMLKGSKIISVDCRSTLCRVEVYHDTEEASEKFNLEFLYKVSSKMPKGSIVRKKLADGRYKSTVFLIKSGHSVPVKLN